MLCRSERKRAVLKTDGGRLCVEPVPEDIAKDQVLVIRTKQTNEETLVFEGFAFVGVEALF